MFILFTTMTQIKSSNLTDKFSKDYLLYQARWRLA